MARSLTELEKELSELSPKDRASLARSLIDSLEPPTGEDFESLWLAEAERRYDNYLQGKAEVIPYETAMANARKNLGE